MGAPDAPGSLSGSGCRSIRSFSGILRQQRHPGTPKIIRNYGCTIRVDVERPDLAVGHFEQMGRLSPRGRAGIQDPLTGLRVEQLGRTLGPDVLHAHQALGKARNAIHRQGLVQHQPVLAHQTKADAGFLKPRSRGKLPALTTVGPQAERCTRQRCGEDLLPAIGPELAHLGHPPAGMVEAGLVGQGLGHQAGTLACKATQRGVDETGCARMRRPFGQLADGPDGLIDDDRHRSAGIDELGHAQRLQGCQQRGGLATVEALAQPGQQALLAGGVIGHVAHRLGRRAGQFTRVVVDALVQMGTGQHVTQGHRSRHQLIGQGGAQYRAAGPAFGLVRFLVGAGLRSGRPGMSPHRFGGHGLRPPARSGSSPAGGAPFPRYWGAWRTGWPGCRRSADS